jgi:copper chaperone CopZ
VQVPTGGIRNEEDFAMIVDTYKVAGMTCGHCVSSVTAAISGLGGVEHVDVDLGAGLVTVKAKHGLDRADLSAAIDDAGFELMSS